MADQIFIDGQQPLLLTATRYVLGRGEECDIQFPADDSSVSRRHAILQCDEMGTWSIVDLVSTNGTFVNDAQIPDRRQLRDGDRIGISKYRIILYAPRSLPVEATVEQPIISIVPPPTESPVVEPPYIATPVSQPAAQPIIQIPVIPAVSTEPIPPTTPSIINDQPPAPATATFPGISNFQEVEIMPQLENPTVELTSTTPLAFPQPKELRHEEVTSAISASIPPEPSAQSRQCTNCRAIYSDSHQICPDCGSMKFKTINAGGTATVVTPQSSSTVAASDGQSQTVQVPKENTPFDHSQNKTTEAPQPDFPSTEFNNPKDPASQSSELWDSIRNTFTPNTYRADSVSFVPEDQLLIFRFLSWVAAPLMLISLALPWVKINIFGFGGNFSYLNGMMEVASAGPKEILQGISQEPSTVLVLLPLLMTILLIGAAGYAYLAHQSKIASAKHLTPQIILSLIAGVPGVLGVAWFYYQLQTASQQISFLPIDVRSFVGMGIPTIGLASLLAVVAGILGIVLMSQHQ